MQVNRAGVTSYDDIVPCASLDDSSFTGGKLIEAMTTVLMSFDVPD